tara:strand:+ start:115 stop:762 length:648 start_codon:yes stop_codon:yes gene_type:complete
MSLFKADNLESLKEFKDTGYKLGILKREQPEAANSFFQKLIKNDFKIDGTISLINLREDLENLVQEIIPDQLSSSDFYNYWLSDMETVCRTFLLIEKTDSLCFWLGTKRECRRYHIDNVPRRLLVTYAGQGTEWIQNQDADLKAYEAGEPNEKIVRDKSKLNFIDTWNIAIFTGGSDGILHRTPDSALNGPSILMRLDHPEFLDSVYSSEVLKLN